MLFICYSRCSTCAKAKKWLEDNNLPYTWREIKRDNPSVAELTKWHKLSGLPIKRFFNTSGQVYRNLQLKDKLATMSTEEALAVLSTDGMLVRRPLLIHDDMVLVGFSEAAWAEALL